MVDREYIAHLAYLNNVNITNYPIKLLHHAFNIEWEHAKTVNSDVSTIFKIVLDHLKEFPDYYSRLNSLEAGAKRFWNQRQKPQLFTHRKNNTINISHA
jgi:hypothetical protein